MRNNNHHNYKSLFVACLAMTFFSLPAVVSASGSDMGLTFAAMRENYLNSSWCQQNIPRSVGRLRGMHVVSEEVVERTFRTTRACLYVLRELQRNILNRVDKDFLETSGQYPVVSLAAATRGDKNFDGIVHRGLLFHEVTLPGSDVKERVDHWNEILRSHYFGELTEQWKKMLLIARRRQNVRMLKIDFTALFEEFERNYITDANDSFFASTSLRRIFEVLVDSKTHIASLSDNDSIFHAESDPIGGVGALLWSRSGKLVIGDLNPGGAAELAGLRSCDIVETIDGEPVNMESGFRDVVRRIRGEKGTEVKIGVRRGDYDIEVPIKRDHHSTPFLRTMIQRGLVGDDPESLTLMIKMDAFYGQALTEGNGSRGGVAFDIYDQLVTIKKDYGRLDQVLIDLTTNGGGLLKEALMLADMFLPTGKYILGVRDLDNGQPRYYRTRGPAVYDGPLVLLMGRDSASASEVLAGALVAYGRAIVVGERSYGKGSVQVMRQSTVQSQRDVEVIESQLSVRLPTDFLHDWGLTRTIQRFYHPIGVANQGQGIDPHFKREWYEGLGVLDVASSQLRSFNPVASGSRLVRNIPSLEMKACVLEKEAQYQQQLLTDPHDLGIYACDRRTAAALASLECQSLVDAPRTYQE